MPHSSLPQSAHICLLLEGGFIDPVYLQSANSRKVETFSGFIWFFICLLRVVSAHSSLPSLHSRLPSKQKWGIWFWFFRPLPWSGVGGLYSVVWQAWSVGCVSGLACKVFRVCGFSSASQFQVPGFKVFRVGVLCV